MQRCNAFPCSQVFRLWHPDDDAPNSDDGDDNKDLEPPDEELGNSRLREARRQALEQAASHVLCISDSAHFWEAEADD